MYIESVNLGADHFGTTFLSTLGVKYVDDGIEDMVNYMLAQNDTLLKDVHFQYAGGDSPHFSIDKLSATDSEILYHSDDGNGRIFIKNQEYGFKVISSSIVAAALRNGDSLSMKPYLFAEMIDYMLGITTITSLREAFGVFQSSDKPHIFPNPAVDYSNISFNLSQKSDVSLQISDNSRRIIFMDDFGRLDVGDHVITWNLTDNFGRKAEPGNYFFILNAANQIKSGKIIVIR